LLILFDLDDTLIDTSGSITPYRLREILSFLLKQGAPLPPLEEAFLELQKIIEQTDSTQRAVKNFLERYRIGGFFPQAEKLLSDPLPPDFNVLLCPGAKKILQDLHPFHDLALVTRGFFELQRQKWEKAGLEPSIFCKIIVVDPMDKAGKKKAYELLIKEKKRSSREVLVCGDHISNDLLPAKELGIWTVLMQWGKGKLWKENLESVDFTIAHLEELQRILDQLEKKGK
jgi:putative hydrolase of the HAD superfamily